MQENMADGYGVEGTTSPGEKNSRRRRGRGDSVDGQIHVSRPAFTASQLRSKLCYTPHEEVGLLKGAAKSLRSCVSCSPGKVWALLLLRVPILGWLPKYKYKTTFVSDLISGFTVGVMHLPQGMGYAMMAEVPPIIGLYTAVFPVLGYLVFGTSRHISMGTFAVGTLMTGKIVVALSTPEANFTTHTNATDIAGIGTDVPQFTNIQVATAAAFMVGVWQIIFAFLNLGKVSILLPDMIISGFSTGAAFHVFSSQVKNIIGIKLKRHEGPFYLIALYREVYEKLLTFNLITVIISAICLTVLGTYNEVFKPRLAKISNIPIPVDLFMLIIGTAVTHYAQLNTLHGVTVVGHIPKGLPPAVAPDYRLFRPMLIDTCVLAIIVYVICFSLAKIFSKKHGYAVDSTQELYAGGISNIFGSFFSIVPSCASLSRSMVQETAGGKTQIVSLVSCSVLVVVLLFVGPYFESLPTCVLSAIILVALKGLFLHALDCVNMWKHSKEESLLWMVTFLAVVIVDVDYGVGIGVLFNILLLLKNNNKPIVTKLGWVPKTDIYVNIDTYKSAVPVPGASLVNVSGALHSANIEHFKEQLIIVSEINTTKIISAKAKREKRERKEKKKAALNNQPTYEGITTISQDTTEEGVDSTATGNPRRMGDQIIAIENSSHNPRSQVITEQLATMFRSGSSSYMYEDGQQAGVVRRNAEQGHVNKAYLHDDVHMKYSDTNAQPSGFLKRCIHSAKGPLAPAQDVSFMVLCLSGVGWIDVSAAKELEELFKEHKNADISLTLAGTNDSVMQMLKKCDVLDTIPENCFYISVHDAVTSFVAEMLNSKTQQSNFVEAKDGVKEPRPNTRDARSEVVPAMLNSHNLRLSSGLPPPIQLRASHLERYGMEGAAEDFEYYQTQRNFAHSPQYRDGHDARNAERKRAKNRGNNSNYYNSKLNSQPRDGDFNTRF